MGGTQSPSRACYSKDNSPVTASILLSAAGPMAQQVGVPSATWVRPASWITCDWQPGSGGLIGDRVQILLADRPQHDLRLSIAQPGREIWRADAGKRRSNGRVRRLRRDLAAAHTEIAAHYQDQLGLHDCQGRRGPACRAAECRDGSCGQK